MKANTVRTHYVVKKQNQNTENLTRKEHFPVHNLSYKVEEDLKRETPDRTNRIENSLKQWYCILKCTKISCTTGFVLLWEYKHLKGSVMVFAFQFFLNIFVHFCVFFSSLTFFLLVFLKMYISAVNRHTLIQEGRSAASFHSPRPCPPALPLLLR